MTTVSPYIRFRHSERLQLWGVAARGQGRTEITEVTSEGDPSPHRISLRMTVLGVGVRNELLIPEGSDGYGLALKGDAFFMKIKSGASFSDEGQVLLPAADSEANRVRLTIEGTRHSRWLAAQCCRKHLSLAFSMTGAEEAASAWIWRLALSTGRLMDV